MNELKEKIEQWANDRNLILGATPQAQMLKLIEEVGELSAAIQRKNTDGIKDGLGDTFVVITILAAQMGLDLTDCVAMAYDEIKDRKGQMISGIFVKEGDL